jgi:hypothetical protein
MTIGTFSDRILASCGAELAVFIAGGLAGAVAHAVIQSGADTYFAGFFAGVSMCALVLSVLSAIPKLKRPAKR